MIKTVFTALISAVIGGLVAALFIYTGVSGLPEGNGEDVVIREAPPSGAAKTGGGGGNTGGGGNNIEEVYDRYGPGVVSLDIAAEGGSPAGGSGFVLDKNGHIVTNQHVVDKAESISVQFPGGSREKAEVIGEDASTDLALLKVDAPEEMLKPLKLGDSGNMEVGDQVVAIGNPLSVGISVTSGIVSGLDRSIEAPNSYTIDGALQTDAAVNRGSSGGPLLDERGNVIGVTSQIASSTGSFQGVGFAVPSNTVKSVVEQLSTDGDVEHAYLGVSMLPVGIEELAAYSGSPPAQFAGENDLPENGAIVREAEGGGPADNSGIEGGEERQIEGVPVPIPEGDVITKVEGEKVSGPEDVISEVNSRKPGDRMEITVVGPGGDSQKVTVRLGSQPQNGS